ncbi:leucyl/phenylalanyl-tRNA--protein transferase [Sphingobium algorifonticola]|uniref:Leucyl/phenylalanyl-tRNA--protein transferase n=1 Tax=Sphingobium algorifonticola TaxID=2008318 RepID=A0A437JC81_9SPHN|nr:leucyl/phenylalanyl-tRNA--protein transferase [Sphingobium algorifonticola]RVT43363.1 leucyl/phenylalanyl-tRNA--protein transferase [Sphingobium algorifonticola]
MTIDPVLLLQAYAIGVFPMSDDREAQDIYWVEPKRRAILPLDGFRLSRSLAKTIRRDRFTVRANSHFAAVVALCAQSAPDRPSTWINHSIETAYLHLHRLGFAHSIECWDGDDLVGGLYGVALGRAFFGESMFSRRTDASKVALGWLVARLRSGGFTLLDCQFMTGHLASLGAIEVRQADYLIQLSAAIRDVPMARGRAILDAGPGPESALAFAPIADADAEITGRDVVELLGQDSLHSSRSP